MGNEFHENYEKIISLETYHEWIAEAAYYIYLKRIGSERFDPPPAVGATIDWFHGLDQINEIMREHSIAPGTW